MEFRWQTFTGSGAGSISDMYRQYSQQRREQSKRRGLHPAIILLITIVIMAVYFFFALPSLSPMGTELYFFIILGIIVYWLLALFFGRKMNNLMGLKISAIVVLLCILIPFIGGIISAPLFRAKDYAAMLEVREGVFAEEVDKIQLDQVPIVDREAASVIGEKQMGALGDLVSQFDIATNYSQVNIAGKPIRVSPLRYADVFRYLGNFRDGIQYYVSVDMTTQDGELNKLEKPIFYSESDWLMRDLDRHLRFKYPFALLGESNFEIDDDGNAWYVTPKLTKRIGFFNGLDSEGVILTDANSGESTFLPTGQIPEWVDRAYPSELIIQQLDWYGLYRGGFFNSIFGQRNVTSTTEGYNYISQGTDIYLITGVTSVRADTSNLGFYYVNLRTKDAVFYPQPSATEYAAMQSAAGKVQEKNYQPTFPVILNIQDRPVYFMSLKDQSLTAKMFALVDAEQFTDVVVGNTVTEVMALYLEQNPGTPGEPGSPGAPGNEEFLTLKAIAPIVSEGNTLYYFTVQENDLIYQADPSTTGPMVAFLEPGQRIRITSVDSGTLSFVLSLALE